jgi:hypothetical protein
MESSRSPLVLRTSDDRTSRSTLVVFRHGPLVDAVQGFTGSRDEAAHAAGDEGGDEEGAKASSIQEVRTGFV